MKTQFLTLERKRGLGGRDVVDHPKGAHDDIANSVAGVIVAVFENIKVQASEEELEQRLPSKSSQLGISKKRDEKKECEKIFASEMRVCPKCGGTGIETYLASIEGEIETKEIVCSRCKGKKQVKKYSTFTII